MSWYPDALQPLLAVGAATLDTAGHVVDANAGFLRLFGLQGPAGTRFAIDGAFLHPRLATIAATVPAADWTATVTT